MAVKISSLRVSAELDASKYTAGAAQKEAADKRIIQSSQSVGQALAAQDAQIAKLGPGVQSLSRAFIDGYGPAAKFESAIKSLSGAMDRGLGADRASLILQGIETKFGRTADAAKLAEQGFVSLAPVAANLNRNIDGSARSQDAFAKSAGLARHELINLGRQAQDVAVSLAGGQGLGTVLMQQGSQIADVFAASRGSFGGFVSQVATGSARAVTSVAGLTAGVVAAGAGLVYLQTQYADGQREIERALLGIGRSAGVSVATIRTLASEVAKVNGGSAANARGTITALAGTGAVPANQLASIAGKQRDLAATLGVSSSEANKLLAESFSDPIKGAETLNTALGGIDRTMQAYIRRLVESGREEQARNVLLDAMSARLGKASELTSVWARTWNAVTAAASNAADAVGKAVDDQLRLSRQALDAPQGGTTRQAALQQQKAAIEANIAVAKEAGLQFENWTAALARVNSQLATTRGLIASTSSSALVSGDSIRADAAGSRAAAERAKARVNADRFQRGDDASRDLGTDSRRNVDNLDSLISKYNQLVVARRAANDMSVADVGGDGSALEKKAEIIRKTLQIEKDIATARGAIQDQTDGRLVTGADGLIDRANTLSRVLDTTKRINEEGRVQRLETTAVTQAQREAAAIERERLNARQAGVQAGGDDERRAREANAVLSLRAQVEAQLSESARSRIRTANDNISLAKQELATIGQAPEAIERQRIAHTMINEALVERRRLYGDAATLPDAEAASIRRVADEQARVNQLKREASLNSDIGFEREQIFRSDSEQGIASRLRGTGVGLNSMEADALRLNEALRQVQSTGAGALSEIGSAAMRGKLGMDTLLNASLRLGDQLIQMASNMLIKQLLSSLMGGSGIGGMLGGLFGGSGGIGGMASLTTTGGLFAKGGAFSGGNVIPFAKGGAFTNSIVDRPTIFPFAKGVGLMGEAGPEAIMPLRRGPGGSLGVHAVGGGGGVTVKQGDINVVNNTPAQVTAKRDSKGNAMIEIMDAANARGVSQGLRGRGAFAGALPNAPDSRVG